MGAYNDISDLAGTRRLGRDYTLFLRYTPFEENVNDILLTIKRNFKLYLVESLPYYGLALLAGILLFADYLWRKHWYNSRRKASDT